jgi:hypothetical protein
MMQGMSRPFRFLLLLAATGAAGVAAGFLLRFGGDIWLSPSQHTETLPSLPGQSLPHATQDGWQRPAPGSPEGRLIDQMIAQPMEFGRDRLLSHLVDAHPAVRETVIRLLGRRMRGSGDTLVLKALQSRMENERDPVVRSAVKAALEDVQPPPP